MTTTDILVIGAGPAGLAAAIEARRTGADVLLVDENAGAGGQLFKQIHKFFGSRRHHAGQRGFRIGQHLVEEATALGVQLCLDCRVVGVLDHGQVALRQGDGLLGTVMPARTILATGARENTLIFPGWTLPGVMPAGAAQTFTNIHHVLPGHRMLIVGSGNVGLIIGQQMLQAGADVLAVIECAGSIGGYQVHAAKLRRLGVPVLTRYVLLSADGTKRVEQAVIAALDDDGRPEAGSQRCLEVDTILLAVGLRPRLELAMLFGCPLQKAHPFGEIAPDHDMDMRSGNPSVFVCGDLTGVEEATTALEEGRLAGISAAADLGYLSPKQATAMKRQLHEGLTALRAAPRSSGRLSDGTKGYALADEDVLVCRCEEVSRRDIAAAIADGRRSITAIKRQTRAGMGACQGRSCAALVADMLVHSGVPVSEALSPDPVHFPTVPVPIASLELVDGD